MIGTQRPAAPRYKTVFRVTSLVNISVVIPCSFTAVDKLDMFMSVGVPTAAKGTGVLFEISATMHAATGGKPSPTRSGAARAAGVP